MKKIRNSTSVLSERRGLKIGNGNRSRIAATHKVSESIHHIYLAEDREAARMTMVYFGKQ